MCSEVVGKRDFDFEFSSRFFCELCQKAISSFSLVFGAFQHVLGFPQWGTTILEPRAECAQIDHSGAHFVDFWSHWQKLLDFIILELLL